MALTYDYKTLGRVLWNLLEEVIAARPVLKPYQFEVAECRAVNHDHVIYEIVATYLGFEIAVKLSFDGLAIAIASSGSNPGAMQSLVHARALDLISMFEQEAKLNAELLEWAAAPKLEPSMVVIDETKMYGRMSVSWDLADNALKDAFAAESKYFAENVYKNNPLRTFLRRGTKRKG